MVLIVGMPMSFMFALWAGNLLLGIISINLSIQPWVMTLLLGLIVGTAISGFSFLLIDKQLTPNSWKVFWLGTIAIVMAFLILFTNDGINRLIIAVLSGFAIGVIQCLQLSDPLRKQPVYGLVWVFVSTVAWLFTILVPFMSVYGN